MFVVVVARGEDSEQSHLHDGGLTGLSFNIKNDTSFGVFWEIITVLGNFIL